jgi:hypothetical protein
MVTDTAPLRYPFYHKPQDTPEKVQYDFLNHVVEGLKGLAFDLVTSPIQPILWLPSQPRAG